MKSKSPVYVIDTNRTPFLKSTGKPGPFTAADLLVAAGRPLLYRQPFSPEELDEVIIGCVIPSPDEVNVARVFSLRLGCGPKVPAWTVQRNCGSGMQAIETGVDRIRDGHSKLVLAGGVDSMSHAPVLYNNAMVTWLGTLLRAKNLAQKTAALTKLRLKHFKPVFGILKGLTDPVVNLSMGQTAEILADKFHISREEMDEYAFYSHKRLATAIDDGRMKEVTPIYDKKGTTYIEDDGLRRDTTIEKLARLRPVFDKGFGRITAGNGAQITDGAALLLLADQEMVAKYNLPVLGEIIDTTWAGLPPEHMGLGPVHAVASLFKRNELDMGMIDYWELNEAFAGQVLSCCKAMEDKEYCHQHFDMDTPIGTIDQDKLNVDGGAISLGHPVGASGARIVMHLLHILHENKANLGVATLCIGGGQGGAMLVKRVDAADV